MRPFGFPGKTALRAGATSHLHRLRWQADRPFAFRAVRLWLTVFFATDELRNPRCDRRAGGEAPAGKGSFPMAVRGKDRISRQRKRARRRIFGAAFVLLGILLWGVAAIAPQPEALTYAGITIMFTTTL